MQQRLTGCQPGSIHDRHRKVALDHRPHQHVEQNRQGIGPTCIIQERKFPDPMTINQGPTRNAETARKQPCERRQLESSCCTRSEREAIKRWPKNPTNGVNKKIQKPASRLLQTKEFWEAGATLIGTAIRFLGSLPRIRSNVLR